MSAPATPMAFYAQPDMPLPDDVKAERQAMILAQMEAQALKAMAVACGALVEKEAWDMAQEALERLRLAQGAMGETGNEDPPGPMSLGTALACSLWYDAAVDEDREREYDRAADLEADRLDAALDYARDCEAER